MKIENFRYRNAFLVKLRSSNSTISHEYIHQESHMSRYKGKKKNKKMKRKKERKKEKKRKENYFLGQTSGPPFLTIPVSWLDQPIPWHLLIWHSK